MVETKRPFQRHFTSQCQLRRPSNITIVMAKDEQQHLAFTQDFATDFSILNERKARKAKLKSTFYSIITQRNVKMAA